MFQTNVVQKIRIHILRSMNVFRKSCRLCENDEKYGRAKYTTDEITARMRLPCRIKKKNVITACFWQEWLCERARV